MLRKALTLEVSRRPVGLVNTIPSSLRVGSPTPIMLVYGLQPQATLYPKTARSFSNALSISSPIPPMLV